MKRYLGWFGFLMAMVIGLGVSGCGMENSAPQESAESQNRSLHKETRLQKESLLQQDKLQKLAPHTLNTAETPTISPTMKAHRLFPSGHWKGSWKDSLGQEHAISLSLTLKKIAALPRKAPRQHKPSFWEKLSPFRSAHACGPYGEPQRYAVSASGHIAKLAERFSTQGNAETHDAFDYSSSVSFQYEGFSFYGSVFLDPTKQTLRLVGGLYALQKDGSFGGHLGNFTLERISSVTL
jgi:hypothetical protein